MPKIKVIRKFPCSDKFGGKDVILDIMTRDHADALAAFTTKLSRDDLMFLRLDIRDPEIREQWLLNIEAGSTLTVVALDAAGALVGYSSLHVNDRTWTSHIGEFRVFVAEDFRGSGLSTRLINETMQIAREMKLERLVVNIAREQRRFRGLLEEMGFQAEALLTDWLKSRDGRTHDLVIMSHYLNEEV